MSEPRYKVIVEWELGSDEDEWDIEQEIKNGKATLVTDKDTFTSDEVIDIRLERIE